MNDRPFTPENTICLQCGDVGFSNALVYCVKCLEFGVHRYCLELIPKSPEDFVRWVCDDCEASEQKKHPLPNISDHNLGMKKNDDVPLIEEELVCESGLTRSYDGCAKMELVDCYEDLPCAADELSPGEKTTSSSMVSISEASSVSSKTMKTGTPCATDPKDQEHNFAENLKTDSGTVDCNTPVMAPIWRGCFFIRRKKEDDDKLEGVMAHVSTLACPKVHNETRHFNPVLHLEMLPVSRLWPKSFEKSESVAGDIALYFFPSEKTERIYDELVDKMAEEELALKTTVQNAELLVFPSTKLPLSYWRFQGKYYLWGVFRERRYKPLMGNDRVDSTGAISPHTNSSSSASRTC